MRWCFFLVLHAFVSIYSTSGLQSLSYTGEYVIFRPDTSFIKFDVIEEMDILLLGRTNKPNTKLSDIDYLYRVQLVLDDESDNDPETFRINCSIYKKKKVMTAGFYEFRNKSEKDNMAVRWGSDRNIIDILTELDGYYTTIFSWRDRIENRTSVKYVGLSVGAPVGARSVSADGNRTYHRHWKIKEAEPNDVDIQNTYRVCNIKLLSDNSTNSSRSIYEIFITREQDENFAISLQKGSKEIMRTKTAILNPGDIVLSWDTDNALISFGLRNSAAPIFIWKDTEATAADFARIKFLHFYFHKGKQTKVLEYKNDTFASIPDLYPKYFTNPATNLTRTLENPNLYGSSDWPPKVATNLVPDDDLTHLADVSS